MSLLHVRKHCCTCRGWGCFCTGCPAHLHTALHVHRPFLQARSMRMLVHAVHAVLQVHSTILHVCRLALHVRIAIDLIVLYTELIAVYGSD